jgi:hypothetical protein
MPKEMTHNNFKMKEDILTPLEQFFTESNIVPNTAASLQICTVKNDWTVPPPTQRKITKACDLEQL